MKFRSIAAPATRAFVFLGAVLVAACGGDEPTGPEPAPTVASITVSPDSVTVPRGGSVQLSATVRDASGNPLTGHTVTWTTATPDQVSVSANGLVTASPLVGRAVVSASAGGQTASAVIRVEGGVFDLAVVDAQFTQGVQRDDGGIPMILQGNGAVLNVLLSSTLTGAVPSDLVLRLSDHSTGEIVYADTARVRGVLGPSPDHALPSVQFLVPSADLRPGLAWQVVRDPAGTLPDDDPLNDVHPRDEPRPLEVVSVPTLRLHFVPIVLSAHGNARGDVTTANVEQYVRVLLSALPLGRVEITVGDPFTTAASFGVPPRGGEASFWTRVLSELDAARLADPEAGDAHWYGVVRPPSGFNFTEVGGYAYIPGSYANLGSGTRTAVGTQVGWFTTESQARDLVAHELGHNFGRRHSPCGGPPGVDPGYPVPGGAVGRVGHDAFSWTRGLTNGATTIPASVGDLMGYCHPVWASAYTYEGVLAFRNGPVAAPPTPTRVLLVRGRIDADGPALGPAFTVRARPSVPRPSGSWVLEGLDADARVLFAHAFEPDEIDHAPGVRTFAVAVDLPEADRAALWTLRVRGPDGAATRVASGSAVPGAPGMSAPAVVAGAPGTVRVVCGPEARGVLVAAPDGRVLGMADGPEARVAAAPGATLDVVCSDGVRTGSFQVEVP